MKSLDDRLGAVVHADIPGATAVAVRPGSRWEGAAGIADVRTGEPLTPDHRFRIGSVTKIFVAAVVLQLVNEGRLELDGDAGPLVEGVTIRQLLNHTSGLPDWLDDVIAFFEPYRENQAHRFEIGHRDQIELVKEKPRLFPPGAGWTYAGANYLALGLIVEEATGSTLREELKRRIAEPLGLDSTDLLERPPPAAGFARGYFPADNPVLPGPELVDVTDLDLPFYWAGGGVVSTARDVARFLHALLGDDFLPSALRAEMLTTVVSKWNETDEYGLGIGKVTSIMGKAESPCGAAWGHIGFSAGYTAIALASESGDRQVVIMLNGDVDSDETWQAIGGFIWAAYCSGTELQQQV
jgi:D-alanyl-D-alanine carboxypeptidase